MIDSSTQASSVRSAIVQHNRLMLVATSANCVCKSCQSTGCVRRKDMRKRAVRFWELCPKTAQLVVTSLPVTLVRWQCKACGYMATEYPDFRPSL